MDLTQQSPEVLDVVADRVVRDDELDHPVVDIDGMPVPGESMYKTEAYQPLRLSLLREGDRGRFVSCFGDWPDLLSEGISFTVGPREEETNRWCVQLPDGPELLVTHQQADTLVVEPVGQRQSAPPADKWK